MVLVNVIHVKLDLLLTQVKHVFHVQQEILVAQHAQQLVQQLHHALHVVMVTIKM
jgi:hypothetical protein